jgi:hypothetical protein
LEPKPALPASVPSCALSIDIPFEGMSIGANNTPLTDIPATVST